MSQPNQFPQQREAIVDKLHGALATFRRERDEVHRAKELAFERLRLVRQERIEAERNVRSLQDKYDQMMQSISQSNGNDYEIAKMQVEVERLSREVRWMLCERMTHSKSIDFVDISTRSLHRIIDYLGKVSTW